MNKHILLWATCLTIASPLSADDECAAPASIADITASAVDVQKVSETFGHLIGSNLENPGFSFDAEAIIAGINNAVEGKAAPMTPSEYEQAMNILQANAYMTLADSNLKEAVAFLEENREREEVCLLEEGRVQYIVLQEGTGEPVAPHSSPTVSFTGEFLDGTLFTSSEEAGGPISISLDETIPGFAKAIEGMQEGETRKVFIHPDLGYGMSGQLPPNSLLTFEVELVKTDAVSDELSYDTCCDLAEIEEPTADTIR